MPIIVTCECGRQLRARDELAGRRAKCPGCGMLLLVEPPVLEPAEDDLVEADAAPPPLPAQPIPAQPVMPLAYAGAAVPQQPEPLVYGAEHPLPVIARAPEEIERLERSWRGNLFWLLLLAMIPLAWLAFVPNDSIEDRIRKTLEANPAVSGRFAFGEDLEDVPIEQFEEMLQALPGKRIQGALLARHSVWH